MENNGDINIQVELGHLDAHPEERILLKPFLHGFDVTWGNSRRAFNTHLSAYFIKPKTSMLELFGFSREILMVYSSYSRMQSRTIQAAEQFLNEIPAKGRLDNLNYFIISEDKKIHEWVIKYIFENPESRIIVAFSAEELRTKGNDARFVSNNIAKYLYRRDLFDYRLPLLKDIYFFGRKDILAILQESIDKCENAGLFGLRKTGKTSILYKLDRSFRMNNSGKILSYDCLSASINSLRWYELLARICEDISKEFNLEIRGGLDKIKITDTFSNLIERSNGIGRIVLLFDEIENISPKSPDNIHWKNDFTKFWQAIRSVQSRNRNICTIIVGVNPYPVEIDTINEVQNPLFGIVSSYYLRGLDLDDMSLMVDTLGKKMGILFDKKSIEYIFNRYGGHPLLTRLACSYIHRTFDFEKKERPIPIAVADLQNYEENLDIFLSYYYNHIISELKRFYRSEYNLLEMLATGQKGNFMEKAKHYEEIIHLKEYGLVSFDDNGVPRISIPVIEKYIGFECMKKDGRTSIYKIIEPKDREIWLSNMLGSIISDIRLLETLIQKKSMPSLFGPNSFMGADEFRQIKVADEKPAYVDFINTCNLCFVESINNYGKSIKKNSYFWDDIKSNYPSLWNALYKIKLYRHAAFHTFLDKKHHDEWSNFVEKDLEGRPPSKVKDILFVFQQRTLDDLLASIQVESNKLLL